MDPSESPSHAVRTPDEAAALLAPLFADAGGEMLAVLHLDAARRPIELTSYEGGPDEVELPLRAILIDALRLGSEALVIAHNHPSGDPEPSEGDLEATRELVDTARRLAIEVEDHLIFAGGATLSLRALGLL